MWFSFLIVAAGVFISTLDSSMVNIALPAIMDDFQQPLRTTKWVMMVYLLTITTTLLFWGNLADRFDRRRVYSWGLLIFALGSLACSQAPDLHWLIAARLGQALGASMVMAIGPAIIKEIFPAGQLGRGLGLIGIAVSLGLMTGPAVGGVLLEAFSWRAIFLITVPVGLSFSLLARHRLPASQLGDGRRFDAPGAVCWTLALIQISLAISWAAAPEASRLSVLALLGNGLLFLGLLVKIELVRPQPLLPLHLFRQRTFSIGMASAILSFMILFAILFLMPFYLNRVLGLSGTAIGLVMMAIPAAVLLVAPLAGHLADRIGARLLTTSGLFLSTIGALLLAGLTAEQQPWEVALRLALLGSGQAMFLSPNSASILGSTEKQYVGTSAALLATARNLGMLLGIAKAGLLFSLFFSSYTGGAELHHFSAEHTAPFLLAMRHVFQLTAVIGVLGALLSWHRFPQERD
jgi:EmrB/QacA subfamily drug resistance transporter